MQRQKDRQYCVDKDVEDEQMVKFWIKAELIITAAVLGKKKKNSLVFSQIFIFLKSSSR